MIDPLLELHVAVVVLAVIVGADVLLIVTLVELIQLLASFTETV